MFTTIRKTLCLLLACATPAFAQTVEPKQASYSTTEAIVVDFAGGPGKPSDWIGIYPKGVTPSGNPPSIDWLYTNGTQAIGGSLTAGTVTFSAGSLGAGTYSLWFLANNGHVQIAGPTDLAITQANTGPPEWIVSQFRRRHAVVGTAYTGKIGAYAADPDGTPSTYSKIDGPAWLSVSASGTISGTPDSTDTGKNSFTLRVSDGVDHADATMTIEVFQPGTEAISELKVLSYNLWHGWGKVNDGHRKGMASIILSDADLIGTQETVDNVSGSGIYQAQKIAELLGWYYGPSASGDSAIVSRYPITANLTAGLAKGARVKLTTNPLQECIIYSVHLDYRYYGPYEAEKPGASAASVLAEEMRSQRDEEIAAVMPAMAANLTNADRVPVILTGDFNAPSHLDWTPAAAANHGGISGVAWPASTAVENAGMLDSFRVVNPDPVLHPSNTWSPLFLGDAQDRIDFVYYKGASLLPVESQMFHTPIEVTVGSEGSANSQTRNNTWPSDHGAVLTVFQMKPVDRDKDGLSDAWEIENFGDLSSHDGTSDADGDGRSNLVEQMSGSSPVTHDTTPWLTIEPPTEPGDPAVPNFTLARIALGLGWVCERSPTLTDWTTVWSYRADPHLQSPAIQASAISTDRWNITLTDHEPDPATRFYRFRTGE